MRTSLIIIHRKHDQIVGKYLRVRLPGEPYQGGAIHAVEFIPAHKIGVEQHGPQGVVRSSQHVPDRAHVGGWSFDCVGLKVGSSDHTGYGHTYLKRLQEKDVVDLDRLDGLVADCEQVLRAAISKRDTFLADAASRAKPATRKDIQP
jgi:hypothetical protein